MTKFISYAQNLEDVMLWRAFKDIPDGFYIDCGAAWPEYHSVTKAFYDRGWRGINVEPNPHLFQQLRRSRPNDINLSCAVANRTGARMLHVIKDTGLSTLESEVAKNHKEQGWKILKHKVRIATLAGICREHLERGRQINFLKIDVEGLEAKVIAGNNWSRYRPWIVLVEANRPLSTLESYQEWELRLLAAEYVFAYADGLNRFYVAAERSHIIERYKYQPNIFDEYITHEHFCLKAKEEEAKQNAARTTETISEMEDKIRGLKKSTLEVEKHITLGKFRLGNSEDHARKVSEHASKVQQLLDRSEEHRKCESLRADRLSLRLESVEKLAQNEANQAVRYRSAHQKAVIWADENLLRCKKLAKQLSSSEEKKKEILSALKEAHLRLDQEQANRAEYARLAQAAEQRLAEIQMESRKNREHAESLATLLAQERKKKEKRSQILEESKQRISVLAERINRFELSADELRASLADSYQLAQNYRAIAQDYKSQAHALKQSISWRVTAPGRFLVTVLTTFLAVPANLLRPIFVQIFRVSLYSVLTRPSLRKPLSATLQKYPRLYLWLFSAGQRLGLPVTATPAAIRTTASSVKCDNAVCKARPPKKYASNCSKETGAVGFCAPAGEKDLFAREILRVFGDLKSAVDGTDKER